MITFAFDAGIWCRRSVADVWFLPAMNVGW